MPKFRDVTVSVTTADGEDLREWGVQHLRKHNKASCYVQAETDMAFRIAIRPKIPYIAPDAAAAHGYGTRRRGSNRPGWFDMESDWEEWAEEGQYKDMRPQPTYLKLTSLGSDARPLSDNNHCRPSSSRRTSSGKQHKHNKSEPKDRNVSSTSSFASRDFKRTPAPNFHFLASLYLDGRSRPERRVIVYLDPDDDDFNQPHGRVQFKSRWVEGRDGRLQEHCWLFKDVGIETVFDKMLISGKRGASDTVYMREEDDLIAAMNCTDIQGEGVDKEQKAKAGQIVVTLERVKLGEKWEDPKYRPSYKEGESVDVDMEGAKKDVSHTTGFGQARPVGSNAVRVVAYTPYNENERAYATFQFFYRSEEKLRRFHFPDFPKPQRSISTRRSQRQLNNLAYLTPLSISNAPQTTSKESKTKSIAFEDRVKKGERFEDTAPYTFEDGYRDPNSEADALIKEEKKEEPSSQAQNLQSIAPFAKGLRDEQDEVSKKIQEDTRQICLTFGLQIPSAGLYPQRDFTSYPPSLASTPQAPSSRNATPDTDSSSSGPKNARVPKGKGRASSVTVPKTTLPPIATTPFPTEASNPEPNVSISGEYRKSSSDTDADDEYETDKETHHGSDIEKTDSVSELDLENEHPYGNDNDDQGLHSQLGDLEIRKRGRGEEEEDEERVAGVNMQDREVPPGSVMNEKGELMLELPDYRDEEETGMGDGEDSTRGARAKRQKNSQDAMGDEENYLGRDGH